MEDERKRRKEKRAGTWPGAWSIYVDALQHSLLLKGQDPKGDSDLADMGASGRSFLNH